MSKKLLIACYFFPPCPSIGGRRSAKFAKYLAKQGDEIHVIQAVNPFSNISPWLKDIENEKKIQRHELPLRYPVEFVIPPKSLFGKIRYRLYTQFFNLFYAKKNRYDYTIFWEQQYLKMAESLITKHGITNILISGPPFYYAHQTIKLKDKFPNLNIIVDFRDPWIGSPYYGMSSLKQKQQNFEIALLNEVYQKADYFIGPNMFLLNEQKKYILPGNSNGAEFVEISHAFDKDEMIVFKDKQSGSIDKINLVYGGQLYPGTDEILKEFSATLLELRKTDPELYGALQIDFYSPEKGPKRFFKEHEGTVYFHEPVGNEIMSKIAQSTFCMILLAEHNKDFKTTKFLEYSALRKPFIVLGNKGYVARFVEENNLGVSFDAGSISGLGSFLKSGKEYIASKYNRTFDLGEFTFEAVSDKLRNLLK